MDAYFVGQCVTFADDTCTNLHIGLILEIREMMKLLVAEVLWEDGATTVCIVESLRPL